MLVIIDLALDVLCDASLIFGVFQKKLEILGLLNVEHLQELFTHLPVVACNEAFSIKRLELPPFLLEIHVQLANTIDRVRFLPDLFQDALFLELLRCERS